MIRIKNITLGIVMAVVLAVVLFGCQKDQKKQPQPQENNDLAQIIETYFLPDNKRETIEGSFKLCDTNNDKAIGNFNSIYDADTKDLQKKINELLDKQNKFDGNSKEDKSTGADPRQNEFGSKANEWAKKIESGTITSKQLAYEYAFFQHLIYLKYPDSIPPGDIRDMYRKLSEGEVDGCLGKGKSIAANDKPGRSLRDKDREEQKKESQIKWADWILKGIAIILGVWFLVWDGCRGFKYVRRAGKAVIEFVKDLKLAPNSSPSPMAKMLEPKKNGPPSPPVGPEGGDIQQPPSQVWGQPTDGYEFPLANRIERNTTDNQDVPPISPSEEFAALQQPETKPRESASEPLKPTQEEIVKETPSAEKVEPAPPQPSVIPPPKTEAPKSSATAISTWHARIPSGNLFFSLSSTPEYPDTPFEITLTSESEGDFNLTKDPDTLKRLFSMTDQLKDTCELLSISDFNPNAFSSTPGKVTREGEYWRITAKIKLSPK